LKIAPSIFPWIISLHSPAELSLIQKFSPYLHRLYLILLQYSPKEPGQGFNFSPQNLQCLEQSLVHIRS
jgi:hypothetical protein